MQILAHSMETCVRHIAVIGVDHTDTQSESEAPALRRPVT